MGLPIDRLSSRLPRRFPVGAKYVVEGYGGEEGKLRVIARYVVLPGGQRINVSAVFSQPVSPRRWLPDAAPIPSDARPKADPKAFDKNSPLGSGKVTTAVDRRRETQGFGERC